MNVTIEKVLSAQVKVKGSDTTYTVDANITFNESKEITSANGQVYRISDNAQVASFSKEMGYRLSVSYQVSTKAEMCVIVTAISDCLDAAVQSVKSEQVTL